MAEFTPIETQEDLDAIVTKRLDKERKKYDGWMSPEEVSQKYNGYLSPDDVAKKYEGYLSPKEVDEKYSGYLSPDEVAKKDAEIKKGEIRLTKMKVAQELGVPQELADRLTGETEDEIRKDAEMIASFTKKSGGAPLSTTEPSKLDTKDVKRSEMSKMLSSMKGE